MNENLRKEIDEILSSEIKITDHEILEIIDKLMATTLYVEDLKNTVEHKYKEISNLQIDMMARIYNIYGVTLNSYNLDIVNKTLKRGVK